MLTQSIVERIKGAIETGALRAGSAIGQQQLADQLGSLSARRCHC